MNAFDLIIVVAALSAALGGYRLGFLARVASWIGLALGLYAATKVLPSALRAFPSPEPTSKLLIAAVILIGGAFIGQALGLVAGASIGRFVAFGPMRLADRVVGAAVGVLGVLVSVWLLLPSIADVPGAVARQARNSVLARAIDRAAPDPPDTLQALRRLVGETDFPKVFDALRPAPVTGPPPASLPVPSTVVTRVSAATVKVTGQACNRIQEGSGFTIGPDLVVTNAHVVAGEQRGATQVERPDGRRLRATVVVFDPDRDLALLQVPGLGQAPLTTGTARVGEQGAVFGHPGGQQQLRVAPAAISQRVEALGRDLYDSRPTRRDVFILAASLQPGDSGAPLVDREGTVVGVAFAIAPDRPATAYAVTYRELAAVLAVPRSGATPTGPCLARA